MNGLFFVIMNYYFLLFQFFTIEIWKDIPGYDDKYQISSFGRVMNMYTLKFVPNHIHPKWYLQVSFKHKWKHSLYRIHKLVANAFLFKESFHTQVNHITAIKTFNYWWALEWCTAKENSIHARWCGIITFKKCTPIFQYSLEWNFIKKYKSVDEVITVNLFKKRSFLARLYKSHRFWWYIWSHDNEINVNKYFKKIYNPKKCVGKFSKEWILINIYEWANDVWDWYTWSLIRKCCRWERKFHWWYQWKYI